MVKGLLKPAESKGKLAKKIKVDKFVSKPRGVKRSESSIVKAESSSLVSRPSIKLAPTTSLPTVKETKVPQGKVSFDFLNGILDSLVKNTSSLLKISKSEYKSEVKGAEVERRFDQLERKKQREESVESRSRTRDEGKALKIAAPKMPLFDGALEFLKRFAIGTAIMQLINWFSDPEKKGSILKFLEDNFLGIIIGSLSAIALAILAPIIGPMGMIFTVLKVLGFVAVGVGKIALGLARKLGGVARGGAGAQRGKGGRTKPGSRPTPRGGVRGGGGILGMLLTFILGPKIQEAFEKYAISPIEKKGLQMRVESFTKMNETERGNFLNGLKNQIKNQENYIANNPLHKAEQAIAFGSGQGETVTEGRLRKNRALLEAISLVLEEERKQKQQANIQQVSMNAPAATVQPQTTLVSQSSLPALPPTGIDPIHGPAQMYGASRAGGKRKHAGQDFDAGPNDTFYSRIGGEVIYADNAGGGYGNVVDVYNADLNHTERVAEGDVNLVKKGDIISPGTPVQRGTNQTGVFHYEIRTGRATASGSFSGTVDPIAFLNNLGNIQVAKTKPSTPTVSQYASYEQPAGTPALVPIPAPTQNNQNQTASATDTALPASVSAFQVLNTYYNFQVLGFLYKQG